MDRAIRARFVEIGTYRHISEAHIGRCCAELDFHHDARELTEGEQAAITLKDGEGGGRTFVGLTISPRKTAPVPRQSGTPAKRYFD